MEGHAWFQFQLGVGRLLVTLEAAQTSGLPVWAGLTCQPDASGTMCLREGEALTDALAELTARGVPLVSIMHSEVAHIDACLDVLEDHWAGPIGVYAHTGGYTDGNWIFDDIISPHDYAANAKRWFDRGVQIIGGCCGIRVGHIAELQKAL